MYRVTMVAGDEDTIMLTLTTYLNNRLSLTTVVALYRTCNAVT